MNVVILSNQTDRGIQYQHLETGFKLALSPGECKEVQSSDLQKVNTKLMYQMGFEIITQEQADALKENNEAAAAQLKLDAELQKAEEEELIQARIKQATDPLREKLRNYSEKVAELNKKIEGLSKPVAQKKQTKQTK